MSAQNAMKSQRPRELRRRVMLRARMRAGAAWRDACILNVSSRGLMINAPHAASGLLGSTVEVWHGERLIVAEVVWSRGTRAGLRSADPVPVEDILALSSASSLQLTAAPWPQVERRKRSRSHDESRVRARALEFAAITAIAAFLGLGALALVQQALAQPLQSVRVALTG